MVIPMKGQYEQQCNAAALQTMGVSVIKNLKKKQVETIRAWTESEGLIPVNYPDLTEMIIDQIIRKHGKTEPLQTPVVDKSDLSVKMLKKITLKNIIKQQGL